MNGIDQEKEKKMLDVKAEAESLKTMYKAQQVGSKYNFLIVGKPGTRKTYTIGTTAVAPVHIFSFDPNGTSHLSKEVEAGRVIVDTRWEDIRAIGGFSRFAAEFDRLDKGGYFAQVGTCAIDSATFLVESLVSHIAITKGRAGEILAIQDYQELWLIMARLMSRCCKLPCDFILTGHLTTEKDELSGGTETVINLPGQLKRRLSSLFDEVYVTKAKEKPNGIEYTFLTQNNGIFEARSRMGGGVFSMEEPQDLRAMRKKAGKEVADKVF
jgi:hypothetical protein